MASHLTHRPRVTLTRDHYNNALEDVMRTFPEHAALLHEHRAAIVDSLATGNDHAVLATVVHPTAFAAADVAASADALALAAADVTGCLLQVAIVIADHLSLLLGLLGVVGIDVLAPIKAWIGSLAPSVVNFVRTAAAQLVAAASAMDKAKKAAAIMMAVVAAGGLAAVWQSIKNWSWWQWVKLIVGTGATVVAWFASGGTLLIAKVVGVIVNAVTLALDIATMIKVCGPPSSPGQAPDSTKAAYWATGDLKQGSGFVSMQVADVNGDGRDELVQFWNNRGQMGAIVYSWNGSALSTLWGTSNIGQGSGFVSMQVANLRGDGKKQIVQFWNNRGQMGAIVYGWNGTALTTLWGTSNIGQGSGFVSMQVADVNGDGRDEIVQFWNNRGQMGAIVYGWNGSALTTLWGTSNIGQGSGFVSMQVADVNGDHKKEIIQFWNNRGQMGAIVYAWNGSALTTLWGTSNIGQGAGFVSMQALDLIGDGHEDIVQFWNNRGQMGAIVYHWNGTALTTLWGTSNIGQGSGTLGIQSGRYIGNPAAEGAQRETIVQTWSNSGKMSLIYYGWNGTALETIAGETSDQGSGFVSLVTGKVLGDGCDQVVQFWNNRGQMGAIIYAVDQEGKVPTTPAAAGPVAHL